MLSQTYNLPLGPLFLRASARSDYPLSRFSDEAAESIASALRSVGIPNLTKGHQVQDEQYSLLRWKWVDDCCIHFFERHPFGLGVNLDAALNTRFHRLSSKLSWPRFSWVDVDTEQKLEFRKNFIPQTDNLSTLTADMWSEDWLHSLPALENQAIIFLLEDLILEQPICRIMEFFHRLQTFALQRNAPVYVVFDTVSPKKHQKNGFPDCELQTPEEVENVVLSLLSPSCKLITKQALKNYRPYAPWTLNSKKRQWTGWCIQVNAD